MKDTTFGFIGLGLIGGSIARGIKRACPDARIMAYMRTRAKLEQAQADGIVDVILDGIGEPLRECDIIFLMHSGRVQCPVSDTDPSVLKAGRPDHRCRFHQGGYPPRCYHVFVWRIFVGGHPMAGSEKTGYENATDHLLENAYYIVTPTAL